MAPFSLTSPPASATGGGSPARFIVSAVGGFRSSVLASGRVNVVARLLLSDLVVLPFKLLIWTGAVRCRQSSVFALGPVRLSSFFIRLSGTLELFLEARLFWFSSRGIANALSSCFSPLLFCCMASAWCELPSVLDVSSRQGVRPPFESRSCVSLKETRVLVGHPSSIVGSLGRIGTLVCSMQVEVLSSCLSLLYRWWLMDRFPRPVYAKLRGVSVNLLE
ncbi:hypothetical protein YC2023_016276 [Brassica napus]